LRKRARALDFDDSVSASFSAGGPHPTLYTLHPTPYTRHTTPDTRHPTPDTLRPTPHTLHPTPYALHPTPYTWNPNPETPIWTLDPGPWTLDARPLHGHHTPRARPRFRRLPNPKLQHLYPNARRRPGGAGAELRVNASRASSHPHTLTPSRPHTPTSSHPHATTPSHNQT